MKKRFTSLAIAISMVLAGNLSLQASNSSELYRTLGSAEISSVLMTTDDDLTAAQQELQEAITSAETLYGDGSLAGASDLSAAITAAKAVLDNTESTADDLTAAVSTLETAMLAYRIASSTGTAPTVVTGSYVARGSTMALGRLTVSSSSDILEQGFCWSTDSDPSVLDNRSTDYYSNNGNIYKLDGLEPSTVYYVRAYAMTTDYAVGYGDVVKVITIPAGNCTGDYDNGGSDAEDARISAALEGGLYYYNHFTSINGLYISCHYGSSTATADCSYGGWMRVGPNSSYQATGTILHEMAHAVGVGTHSVWYSSTSPMRSGSGSGYWLGDRATEVVRFFDNDDTALLNGDGTHMWPYGINGASEDTHQEILYIANAMIVQALGEDGLPPTSGFGTPAYTFDCEDNVKYYIKNSSSSRGLYSKYLINSSTNRLRSVEMTASEALANDSAAWYIEFDPTTCYYILKNAATGLYFSYQSTGTNGITLISRNNVTTNEKFQLMMSREDTELGVGESTFTDRAYWIIHTTSSTTPPCLSTSATGTSITSSFDLSGDTKEQNWLILTEEKVSSLEGAVSSILLSDLAVNGTTIDGFSNDVREYTMDVDPTSIPVVTATAGPVFDGTIEIEQVTSIPGTAVVTLTSTSGEVNTFSITFNANYMYNWDGQGGSSAPTAYGWSSTPAVTWSAANGSSGCRYMDPGNGEYTSYRYSGADFDESRILWIRYNNSEKFMFSFSGLTPGKSYTLSFKYGWHNNGTSTPRLTAGIYQASDSTLVEGSDSTFSTSYTKKLMRSLEKTFVVPSDFTDTNYYFAITCRTNNDAMIALSDMQLVDANVDTSVDKVMDSSSSLSVKVVDGGVKVTTPEATDLHIHNVTGGLVKEESLTGTKYINLAPGAYIVNGVKAIVK